MKTIKLLFVTLLSFAFIIQPQKTAQSTCGGYDEDYAPSYSFFAPLTFDRFYESNTAWDKTEDDNLNDWEAYFKKGADRADISKIVYQVSADDMQKIRNYVQGKGSLSAELKNNSLIKYWQKTPDLEAIDYLFYAKTCEPHAWKQDSWNEKTAKDKETMRWLADAGKKYYSEKASNNFLKMRFAYQAIRMAQYIGQNDKALEFYDELVVPIFDQSQSVIRYWALAHKAGALRATGDITEANYVFSRIFDECPSKRVSSYLSIDIPNEKVWQGMLDKCKNVSEKSTLYFIRSLDKNSNILEEIKSVYALEPNSDKLPIMLVRSINELEYNLLSITPSYNLLFYKGFQSYPQQDAIKKLLAVKGLVEQVLKEGNINEMSVWTLAAGYLDYVAGTPQRALNTFADLKKKERNNAIRSQIELFETAIEITQLSKIDDKIEDDIYEKVKKANQEHLKELMLDVFARLYHKQGQEAKAYLCKNYIDNIKITPNLEVIRGMLELTDKKNTEFERDFLLPRISNQYSESDTKNKPRDVLKEIEATVLFSQDRLKEAISVYEQIPDEVIYNLSADPFQINIRDCQDCPPSQDAGKYNRRTLATKLQMLKDYADNNTIEQANYYFQLGAAYYNMTYFGNSWLATDYYRSSYDFEPARVQTQTGKPDEHNTVVFADCSKAKFYFDRAMKAALNRGNRELAAQACFMAAKCEQNQYYLNADTSPDYWYGISPSFLPENRRYFQQLAKEYKDTKYYKKALNECTYFHAFVK
jgi:hypothetical protein